ncbi:MAG: PAS domain-containing protein [Herminiimonas sp.]|nr:PAS domain-containing protein [Herminiimonas sp.]
MNDMNPQFFDNTGNVGTLMRGLDWSKSPLGAPSSWPQSLSTVVELILDSKFPMFLAWGPELGFLYNDAYIDVLGDKHPSALGRPFKEIWYEIWSDLAPVVADALEGRATYFENLPLLMNRKGYDEQTWFTFSYSPIRDEKRNVAGIYCACTETTRQVLSEQHRLAENDRLTTLFQQAPGFMAILCEPNHKIELANEAFFRLVGKSDVIGKTVKEAYPELEGQGFFELLDRVYQTGEPYVGNAVPITFQSVDGVELAEQFVDFIYQPIRNGRGEVTGIFIQGNDVTATVHATSAIKDSEAQLRQLANTIPHLAWMANPDGYIHWYNDRWYEYTGTTEEQMLGWGWETVHDPEMLPMVVEHWKSALAEGELWELTFPLRSSEGEFRTFYSRAAPLRDEAGTILQWFGTNTDVTEIKAAQDELKAASARKDDFLAMLAHELRNPLAPISTAAELLKITRLDEARVKQTASIISRQVTHLTKLVDDLLDVSRVTRGLVTTRADILDINELVSEAIEQVHTQVQEKQHRLTVLTTGEPCFVKGDRTRLIQVFANLMNNAARYTPSNGSITVKVTTHDEKIAVSVADNGIGLAPSLTPHIFELFTQGERSSDRGQGGLGLGLALVKSLVELHAGSVSAISEGLGAGSTFTVQLPQVSEGGKLLSVQPSQETLKRNGAGLTLMVVDDNKDAAEMLSLLLETVGHQVTVSHNARDALVTAQKVSPAILFLDIGLPDMDGYELAGRLRAMRETASSILVAVTGYGQPEDKERALQAGFDLHLVKPVKLAAVLGLIENFGNNSL